MHTQAWKQSQYLTRYRVQVQPVVTLCQPSIDIPNVNT